MALLKYSASRGSGSERRLCVREYQGCDVVMHDIPTAEDFKPVKKRQRLTYSDQRLENCRKVRNQVGSWGGRRAPPEDEGT